MNVVPCVSVEQYSILVSEVNDLNFSLQPNEVEAVCHSSPCVDLVFLK